MSWVWDRLGLGGQHTGQFIPTPAGTAGDQVGEMSGERQTDTERERERETETDRQTERERQRQRDRERQRERGGREEDSPGVNLSVIKKG